MSISPQPNRPETQLPATSPLPLTFRVLEHATPAPDNSSEASMPTGRGTPPEGDDD